MVRNHVEKVSELLELPPGVFPVAGLCVGYPSSGRAGSACGCRPRSPCTPTATTTATCPAELDAYDRRREARHATPRESQRFVDRFGYTEPYGWSEDKARQYSVPERHNFGPFIRGHGFGLR